MNRTRLIELLSAPEKLNEDTLDALKEALDAYPFFQAGRMLWIKNLHKLDHIRYNSELKLAAAFIPDRSRLFFLINDLFSPLSEPGEGKQDAGKDNDMPVETGGEPGGSKQPSPPESVRNPASLHTEAEREDKDDSSEAGTEWMTGYEANYFDVDDSVASATGELIDFSALKNNETPDEEEKNDAKSSDENVVLPSAELLDYEKEAYASTYSVEKEVTSASVDFNQSHSFSEWLKLLRQMPPKQEEKVDDDQGSVPSGEEKGPSGKMDLINNFLNNAGDQKRIVPAGDDDETDVPNEDIAAPFTEENEDLMTETLADIHIQQKRYHKAIEIFERLSLKYPEKSVYFARRIEEMEELINNQ
ncbi:MAG: hypothetical protein ACQEQ0_04515 [Bacteroidota bacterium]